MRGSRATAHEGTALEGGGEAEVVTLSLSLKRDERCAYFELFDETDLDRVLERFEEIGAQTEPERINARICRAFNARDWDALRGVLRRRHRVRSTAGLSAGTSTTRPGVVEVFRSWAQMTHRTPSCGSRCSPATTATSRRASAAIASPSAERAAGRWNTR